MGLQFAFHSHLASAWCRYAVTSQGNRFNGFSGQLVIRLLQAQQSESFGKKSKPLKRFRQSFPAVRHRAETPVWMREADLDIWSTQCKNPAHRKKARHKLLPNGGRLLSTRVGML